jgi:hypothetical protein
MALVGNLVSYLRAKSESESVTPDTAFRFNSKDTTETSASSGKIEERRRRALLGRLTTRETSGRRALLGRLTPRETSAAAEHSSGWLPTREERRLRAPSGDGSGSHRRAPLEDASGMLPVRERSWRGATEHTHQGWLPPTSAPQVFCL